MRVFYVIYVQEEPFKSYINAVRLLCDPAEKNSAHLTVRGPYQRRYSTDQLMELNRWIKGERIHVWGTGSFLGPKQNTIFLECESPNLPRVWHKPHYGYRPHVTLYDGASRETADSLLDILECLKIDFQFLSEGLSPVIVNSGQKNLVLRCNISPDIVAGAVGMRTDLLREVDRMSQTERLQWAGEILRVLSGLAEQHPMAIAL